MIKDKVKMTKHKHKFSRRRALDCTLVEKSKSNPGYLKYMITIGEKDGTIHKQPAYGKDMQDAISRLINIERTVKIEKKLETNTGVVFIGWLLLMGLPALFADHSKPWFLFYSMGAIMLIIVIGAFWYKYINRGQCN